MNDTAPIDAFPVPMAPAIPERVVVDTSRVTSWVLEYAESARKRAEAVSKVHIWDRIDAENRAYGLHDKALEAQDAGIKAASLDQTYEVKTKDLADQVDEMTALLLDMINQGEIVRFIAKPGISKEQVELTQKIQEALLKEKQFPEELRKFVGRFVRLCVAGFRVVRSHETSYMTERVEVPLYEEVPATDMYGMPVVNPHTGQPEIQRIPKYTDDALAMRGFSYDLIKDGSALRSALAEDGYSFVGIADMREDGTYDNLLCTTCKEVMQDYVFIKAINPRRIAIADPTRSFAEQPSVHEYQYLTINELRKANFRNVDKLKEVGSKITNTNQQNPGTTADTTTDSTLIVPVYEICESWLELPFEDAVLSGELNEDELRAFLLENGVTVDEVLYPSYRWVVHHNKNNVLLGIYTSYMGDKSEHAFDGESFVYGDGEFSGNSQMERLSNIAANMLAFLNMMARGMKKNLYGSRLISDRLGLSLTDLQRLDQFGGTALVEGSAHDFESEILNIQHPDNSRQAMMIVNYFAEKLRGLGVPSILAGEGQADTATQDTINNRRGQTIVNEAFSRMMNLIVRVYKKHLSVSVNSFTTSRYIDMLGEDGSTMTRRWTMAREITDKIDIVPMMSLNDGEKQRTIQFLLGLMNVTAPILGPASVKAILKLSLEMFGIPARDIALIEGADGSTTNVQQEIKTLLHDPEAEVVVKMEDPHQVCIQMAQIAVLQDNARYEQQGMQPPDRTNIMEYIQMHEGMLEQQRIMAMIQQVGQAGPAGPEQMQGKPQQARPDGGPGDDQGGARQMGQAVGVGNQGPMSAAGLTGQGSVGLVKGAPAGI